MEGQTFSSVLFLFWTPFFVLFVFSVFHFYTDIEIDEAPTQHTGTQPWSTGLCGCFSDISSCCLTCWFPCITYGRIAVIADRGTSNCGHRGCQYAMSTAITFLAGGSLAAALRGPCCLTRAYRTKIRRTYNLQGDKCSDYMASACCEQCVLCQMYRELGHHGHDLKRGWPRNEPGNVAMTPPEIQTMADLGDTVLDVVSNL